MCAPSPVQHKRRLWSVSCDCGWTNDAPTERKVLEAWRDHVVQTRYEEAMVKK